MTHNIYQQHAEFIVDQTKSRIEYEFPNRTYFRIWVRHGSRTGQNHVFIAAGYSGVDRLVWEFLAKAVHDNFSVVFKQDRLPCVLSSSAGISSPAPRIDWTLSKPFPDYNTPDILDMLLSKPTEKFDECLFAMSLERLFWILESNDSPYFWALNPLPAYLYHKCLLKIYERISIENFKPKGLPANKMEILRKHLLITGGWSLDIEKLNKKIDEYGFGVERLFQ